jgi:xanthine dehydrogenase accessory factor
MALTASGRIAGSVSGGCVEGAVVEAGRETLRTGRPQRLHFGVADDTAWAVGLACGGSIDVFVERLEGKSFDPLRDAVLAERTAAAVTVVEGPEPLLGRKLLLFDDGRTHGSLGPELDGAAAGAAREALAAGEARRVRRDAVELFAEPLLPPRRSSPSAASTSRWRSSRSARRSATGRSSSIRARPSAASSASPAWTGS